MTFAEKYKLKGGRPVKIDPETASFVKRIFKKGDDALERGLEYLIPHSSAVGFPYRKV